MRLALGSVIGGLALALPSATARAETPVEAAEAAFTAFIEAGRKGDVVALERLTNFAFAQYHAYGLVEPRASWLAAQRAGTQGLGSATQFSERAVETRIVGDTALRTSIVRLRRAARSTDTWVRSVAVLVNSGQGWKLAMLDSALLHEGPILADEPDAGRTAGRYRGEGPGTFVIAAKDGQSFLEMADGRSVPLVPLGPDRYLAGHGSTLSFERDASGAITAVERKFGERMAWRATPVR